MSITKGRRKKKGNQNSCLIFFFPRVKGVRVCSRRFHYIGLLDCLVRSRFLSHRCAERITVRERICIYAILKEATVPRRQPTCFFEIDPLLHLFLFFRRDKRRNKTTQMSNGRWNLCRFSTLYSCLYELVSLQVSTNPFDPIKSMSDSSIKS